MNKIKVLLFISALTIMSVSSFAQTRVVVLTDFPPVAVIPGGAGYGDPTQRSDSDDVQSMIRFLLYSNEFKVEGLVATSSTFANVANKQHLIDLLYVYDHVDENLRKHDQRYPTADQLKQVTWQGLSGTYGKGISELIGDKKDSEASEKIIALLEKNDEKPIWFCVWGGSADLAQALWKIKETRKPTEAKRLFDKVRIYLIGFQDGSGQWLLDTYPNVFIILSKGNYMGMFNNSAGSDKTLSDLNWINKNIRKAHGILGALYPESGFYPETPGVWEGDSPSFLYLVSGALGINDIENPNEESWGGKFIQPDQSKKHWFDDPAGGITVYKWRADVQKDFAMRADWMHK